MTDTIESNIEMKTRFIFRQLDNDSLDRIVNRVKENDFIDEFKNIYLSVARDEYKRRLI